MMNHDQSTPLAQADDFIEIEAEELELREDLLGFSLSWCCGCGGGLGDTLRLVE